MSLSLFLFPTSPRFPSISSSTPSLPWHLHLVVCCDTLSACQLFCGSNWSHWSSEGGRERGLERERASERGLEREGLLVCVFYVCVCVCVSGWRGWKFAMVVWLICGRHNMALGCHPKLLQTPLPAADLLRGGNGQRYETETEIDRYIVCVCVLYNMWLWSVQLAFFWAILANKFGFEVKPGWTTTRFYGKICLFVYAIRLHDKAHSEFGNLAYSAVYLVVLSGGMFTNVPCSVVLAG